MIISSSGKGYKIPANLKDLNSYIEQAHTVIAPILFRIDNAYKKIKIAFKDELDVLGGDRYSYLKLAIKELKKLNP